MNGKILLTVSWAQTNPAEFIDCDLMVFLLNSENKIPRRYDVIFYNLLKHRSGAVIHQGDDKRLQSGRESVWMDLTELPAEIESLVFLLTVFEAEERRRHLDSLRKISVSITDVKTAQSCYQTSLTRFEPDANAVILGRLHKEAGAFHFKEEKLMLKEYKAPILTQRYGLLTWEE